MSLFTVTKRLLRRKGQHDAMMESFLAIFPRVHQPLKKSYLYNRCSQQSKGQCSKFSKRCLETNTEQHYALEDYVKAALVLRFSTRQGRLSQTPVIIDLVTKINHVVVEIRTF